MRRALAASIVLLAAGVACIGYGRAQVMLMTGAGKGVIGGGATVTFDQIGLENRSNPAVTSFGYLGANASSGLTNPAALLVLSECGAGTVTGISAVWDAGATAQSMTNLGSVSSGSGQVIIFGLRNPTPVTQGVNTTTIAWTGSSQITAQTISFSNVNQTSDAAAFKNFTSATNTAPITVNVANVSGGYVVSGMVSVANFTSVNETQLYLDNACAVNAVAGNYSNSAGTVALTGNPGSATLSAIAAISVSP